MTANSRIVTRNDTGYPLNGQTGAGGSSGTKPQQWALPEEQAEQGDDGHDGSAEFRGYAARFSRSCRCFGGSTRPTAQSAVQSPQEDGSQDRFGGIAGPGARPQARRS